MSIVEVCGLRFGEGRPKICVPLTGGGMPALLSEIQQVSGLPADLFEWRADCFFGNYKEALGGIKARLSAPLLCTVRTENEGGNAELSPEEYEQTVRELLEIGGFAMIDIELSCGEERVKRLVNEAKNHGVAVVMSRHDFAKTPTEDEIFTTLAKMKDLGADLPKFAVMPTSEQDVLTLLSATLRAKCEIGAVITMSMGSLGKISRVSGEIFGSCMTFGSGVASSAPGQINAEDLMAILEDISPGK